MTLSLTVKTADSANLHGFSRLVTGSSGKTSWLSFYTKDYSGIETPELSVFMPMRLAEMIEKAFHAYEDWESGQKGPTFDDALAAKCDADARLTEALEILRDNPAAVHINMLKGNVARPTWEQVKHLYCAEFKSLQENSNG